MPDGVAVGVGVEDEGAIPRTSDIDAADFVEILLAAMARARCLDGNGLERKKI